MATYLDEGMDIVSAMPGEVQRAMALIRDLDGVSVACADTRAILAPALLRAEARTKGRNAWMSFAAMDDAPLWLAGLDQAAGRPEAQTDRLHQARAGRRQGQGEAADGRVGPLQRAGMQ